MSFGPPFGSLTLGAITFRDRGLPTVLAAARAAGFDRVGISVGQCITAIERGIGVDELLARIQDAGLSVGELELVRLGETGTVRHLNALVEDLVTVLQPDRVHVAAWNIEHAVVVDEFAALCDRLPNFAIGFEFMPYNAVPDFASARRLVDETGAANAWIVLDIVHFFRSGGRLVDITAATLGRVAVVQLSDVVERVDMPLRVEARHARTYPGRGTLDAVGFLRAVRSATTRALPLSVEPISDALEGLPLAVVADESMIATQRLLASAR